MNSKGFTLVELLAVIVVMGIISLIGVTSYNSITLAIKNNQRKNLISNIEIKAANYAYDTGKTMIFVDELITEGYIDDDDDAGNIIDPKDSNKRLNCYIVEMEKVKDYYKAKFIDGNNYDTASGCDLEKLEENKESVKIEVQSGEKIGEWYKGQVTLKALSSTVNIDCVNKKCLWTSSSGANTLGVDNIIVNNINGVLKTKYTFQLTVNNDNNEIKRYTDTISLNIDNENPVIYKDETYVTDRFVYTNSKRVTIYASDGSGSGIKGYNLSIGDVNCNNIDLVYQSDKTFTVNSNGNYTMCVKDNVGNVSKSELVINYIS